MTTLKSQTGIDLYALSIQNEPDYVAQWDSCIWRGAEFQNFIKNFLAPTFAVAALTTKVIMPEASGWDFTLAAPTLNDPVAAAGVQIIGAHGYSGSIAPCPLARSHGKRLWETEVSDFAKFDPTIQSGLVYAKKIHDWIVAGGVNAWHYWWLISGNPDNEGLLGSGGTHYQVTKRLYAFGNFSKFIRPGFVRIAATPSPSPGVLVSAYKDPSKGNFAIVAINQGSSNVALNVAFHGFTTPSVTPWVTSASLDLVQQAPLQAGSAFSPTLAAHSVTTFVGLGH